MFLLCEIILKITITYLQSVKYGGYIMPSRKGSPNKPKRLLISRLQSAYGARFHPILRLAENAVRLDEIAKETNDIAAIKAAVEAWDKIGSYTEPKLKAVEIQQENNELIVTINRKDFAGSNTESTN